MVRLSLAIAAASLAAMTIVAAAQGPSYESRGYGGPLYVGPNFQGGGQHSPPIYDGSSSSKKPYKKKRVYQATKPRKEQAKETDTAKSAPKSSPTDTEVETENSSISQAGGEPQKTGDEKPVDTAETGIVTENSTISHTSLETATTSDAAEPKAKQNVSCKKYFPAAGMTLTVPCD
jgi:glucan-binding YG repeat protein